MVIYFNKNPEFSKKRQPHKLFREILAHHLVQPILDKRAEGDCDIAGPGRRSMGNELRFRGKHFSVSKYPTRKSCKVCAYKKKPNGQQRKTKTSNYCEKCKVFVCKICFATYHTKMMYKN